MIGSGPVAAYLESLSASVRPITGGKPATYIPELGKADPALFGIAIMTVDGALYATGDADTAFTIQSVSKIFTYGHALDRLGRARVLKQVGVEPTGDSFNSILLDTVHNRPFNPMVNAGAIAVAELIEGDTPRVRQRTLDTLMERFAGRKLALDEAVYESEKATGARNRAIAWLMYNSGMIRREPEDVLDVYFRQCSFLVDVRDLAAMGATLANDGVHPRTGVRALAKVHVPDVLAVTNMCGMYNYAGQWSYEVGLPAKSGVSGAILLVIPGQAGIAIFSPPLDENGNSVRGIAAAMRIAEDFGLHIFATHPDARSVVRGAYLGNRVRSRRRRPPADQAILSREGARIAVLEAQDALFFGSAERLVRRAGSIAATADWLILDLRRVTSADAAAARLLADFAGSQAAAGHPIATAALDDRESLLPLAAALDAQKVRAHATREAALEAAEDALLRSVRGEATPPVLAFAALDLVAGLAPEDVARVEALAIPLRFAAGEYLARQGEEAPLFFVLTEGVAAIVARGRDGEPARVGSVGPGMTCGEMALVARGRRAADIVAETDLATYGFGIEELDALGRAHPRILLGLMGNLTRELAERLRLANAEIRALEG